MLLNHRSTPGRLGQRTTLSFFIFQYDNLYNQTMYRALARERRPDGFGMGPWRRTDRAQFTELGLQTHCRSASAPKHWEWKPSQFSHRSTIIWDVNYIIWATSTAFHHHKIWRVDSGVSRSLRAPAQSFLQPPNKKISPIHI